MDSRNSCKDKLFIIFHRMGNHAAVFLQKGFVRILAKGNEKRRKTGLELFSGNRRNCPLCICYGAAQKREYFISFYQHDNMLGRNLYHPVIWRKSDSDIIKIV